MILKAGLIGPKRGKSGYGIGHFLARELINNHKVELSAIMSTSKASVKQGADEIKKRKDIINKFNADLYTTKEESDFFNRKDLDLIVICSPKETHENYIKASIKNKKHVLVEKPLIWNPNSSFKKRINKASKLITKAKSYDLFLSTNCQRSAIIQFINQNFQFPKHPPNIQIIFNIGTKNNPLKSASELFVLTISHPISLLVKLGLNDYRKFRIKSYKYDVSSLSSKLIIKGSYKTNSSEKEFSIEINQSKRIKFANMHISQNKKYNIAVTNEMSSNGQVITKYYDKNGNKSLYSEDFLKISISRIVDAVTNNNKKPLITTDESFQIYAIQEKLWYQLQKLN